MKMMRLQSVVFVHTLFSRFKTAGVHLRLIFCTSLPALRSECLLQGVSVYKEKFLHDHFSSLNAYPEANNFCPISFLKRYMTNAIL